MSNPDGDKLLPIYLNDHLAGATAGLELARRARSSNQGTELGTFLARLALEIEEDRETLERAMERLEVGKDRLKVAGGWIMEKLGRLKLNGQLTGYSPLSRVLELETLAMGVANKRAGWEALQDVAPSRTELAGFDFASLVERAERQLEELESHHREAARIAFH